MDSIANIGTADFTDEILAENGLNNIPNRATVIHNSASNNSVVIPESSGLEPPAVNTDVFTGAEIIEAIDSSIASTAEVTYMATLEDGIDSQLNNSINVATNSFDDLIAAVSEPQVEISSITGNLADNMEAAINEALGHSTTIEEASNIEDKTKMLPTNPKSLTALDETSSRFSGAAWYKAVQQSTVILAGLGGIGSYCLFLLSRMKPLQVFIYDDDIVELANLSGQLYSTDMVGKKKVNAMAELAEKFSDYHSVMAVDRKWTEECSAGKIMICGFDNMEARKTFFNSWKSFVTKYKNPEECLFIDGRLSANELQVYCIQGNDAYNIKRYEKEFLFSSKEAEATVCSFKQTTYCANMIGSIITNLYVNFIANSLNPIAPYDLPFRTYYAADMMYFKTES
jgi:molybdopterin/thiamine biosynthesis adenylyltransferase